MMTRVTITIDTDQTGPVNVRQQPQRRDGDTGSGSNNGEGDDGRIKPPGGVPDNTLPTN
ncbi:MAG: hypothetical protein HEP71_24185 [Roseivirga sp.]|nr:hypothetical protein [Roseivirga sp.]